MSGQVSWTKQLVLAVVLVVLGYAAYWVEFKQKPAKEEAEEGTKKVVALKDVPIREITLSDGTTSYQFTCSDFDQKLCKPGDNSKWQMMAPKKLKADDSNVNALVSAANNISAAETISLAEESPEKKQQLLKEYGLDPESQKSPKTRKLVFATPGDAKDKEQVIYLGATHPVGETIFALSSRAPNQVFLLPSYFKTNFDHNLTYWRDKKLLTLASHEVTAFGLDSPKGKLSGDKKDNQWILHQGAQDYTGDIENVDSLLSGAAYLAAKDFAADDKASSAGKQLLAGAKKLAALSMTKEKTPEITLSLYQKGPDKPAPKYYATVSNLDPVFEMDATIKDRFAKSLKDLRQTKLITSLDRFTAKRLELSGPSLQPALVLTQKDGKWQVEGSSEPAANDKVQSLLDKVSGNRIKDFLEGKAIPAGQDQGTTLTLGDEKDARKRQVVFWKSGTQLYAKDLLSNRKEAFVVDSAIESALPKDRGFFGSQPAAAASPATPASGGGKK